MSCIADQQQQEGLSDQGSIAEGQELGAVKAAGEHSLQAAEGVLPVLFGPSICQGVTSYNKICRRFIVSLLSSLCNTSRL